MPSPRDLRRPHPSRLVTGVACAVLLTACGGGGDAGEQAAASSSSAPASTSSSAPADPTDAGSDLTAGLLPEEAFGEGATIAFERQQVAALLESTRRRLADVDAALERRASGGYGVCEVCGRQIPAERLAARPSARTCVACAV